MAVIQIPIVCSLFPPCQMQNTKYGNGFTETHDTIVMFWEVVKSLSEPLKRKLLKFVTSCSRPPLLGFKVSLVNSINSVARCFFVQN